MACSHGRIPALSDELTPDSPCEAHLGGGHVYNYDASRNGVCECGAEDPIHFYEHGDNGGSG